MSLRAVIWLPVLLMLASPARAAEPKPTVAVFDLELKRLELDKALVEALNEYLFTQVAAAGRFDLVPKAQLHQQLQAQKTTSYKECFDQRCQIEIGRELAAQKVISVRVMKLGKQCVVGMTLFDLRRAATEKAANIKGACAEDGLMASLDRAVVALTASPEAPVTEAPRAPPPTHALPDGRYRIRPVHSNACLDVWQGEKHASQRVVQWKCHDGPNQVYKFQRRGYGYSITPVHSGLCLEVSPWRPHDAGPRLVQGPCDSGDNQAFKIHPKGDGQFLVEASHSGKCWDVWHASSKFMEEVIQWDCHGKPNQRFRFLDRDQGLVAIQAGHSGLCLDVWQGAKTEYQGVIQWECHYAPNQLYRKEGAGAGKVRFVAAHSGLCLEILDVPAFGDLQRLQQSTCNKADHQRFEVVPAQDAWVIRVVGRKSCLEVRSAGEAQGELLVQGKCHQGPNQRFRLEPVE